MSKDAFKFLTSYLATFSGDDSHVLSEAKEEAARAIVEFVRAPDVFQVPYLILIMMFGRLYDLTASYIVQLVYELLLSLLISSLVFSIASFA